MRVTIIIFGITSTDADGENGFVPIIRAVITRPKTRIPRKRWLFINNRKYTGLLYVYTHINPVPTGTAALIYRGTIYEMFFYIFFHINHRPKLQDFFCYIITMLWRPR